jgi:hypothetical protein
MFAASFELLLLLLPPPPPPLSRRPAARSPLPQFCEEDNVVRVASTSPAITRGYVWAPDRDPNDNKTYLAFDIGVQNLNAVPAGKLYLNARIDLVDASGRAIEEAGGGGGGETTLADNESATYTARAGAGGGNGGGGGGGDGKEQRHGEAAAAAEVAGAEARRYALTDGVLTIKDVDNRRGFGLFSFAGILAEFKVVGEFTATPIPELPE